VDLHGHSCQENFSSKAVPAEYILSDRSLFDDSLLATLPLRNPENFRAGGLHSSLAEWKILLDQGFGDEQSWGWLNEGVHIPHYFRHYKGTFHGHAYDSDFPPPIHLKNSSTCIPFAQFVADTICQRLQNGSIRLLGKVGEVCPPYLVLPLTVEPSKPRLCHDERFLNLWIKDLPFTLDTLKDVPRLLQIDDNVVSCDDKSGYDHVFVTLESQQFLGIEFGGWYYVYTTLPFGFKGSCYIYQSIGMVVTAYLRNLGISTLQYIDDRLMVIPAAKSNSSGGQSAHDNGKILVYCLLQILTRLGYTLAINKSVLKPSPSLVYLGFVVDVYRQAFLVPDSKRQAFEELRISVLSSASVSVNTLQRLMGKCVSFTPAIPGALLYIRQMAHAIGLSSSATGDIQVSGDLRSEIEFWGFLKDWTDVFPWRKESHAQLSIMTDASLFKWAGVLHPFKKPEEQGITYDFWSAADDRPIHLKEAEGLRQSILSFSESIEGRRVDAYVDNQALVYCWEGKGSKNLALTSEVKQLFEATIRLNVDLKLIYVPSKENVADEPSRSLCPQDAKLSVYSWNRIQGKFGPHSIDLMALDSNAMVDSEGLPLRHFTPFPTPLSSGVNLFAMDIATEANPYVFPPICMISATLNFLVQSRLKQCTMVVPILRPVPVWWPVLLQHSTDSFVVGSQGEKGILQIPSRNGFVCDMKGLPWDLVAFKLSF
jgi:hypothetical protein